MEQVFPAPAKLNLFLHVTGRRADGYHTLQTVFQFLDFGDAVRLAVRADGQIRRASDLPALPAEADLSVRAARRLQAAANASLGADIAVTKRIPMGAGLGGGSSDAATVLVALNHLWGLGWERERLAEIGLGLGADVPVFVHGRAAWAEGVGELLTPVELEEPWYLVIDPGCRVPTGVVFGDPALTRNSPLAKITDYVCEDSGDGVRRLSAARLLAGTRNDCEEVVRRLFRPVDAALAWLAREASARMTGTGSCVFAAFASAAAARAVCKRLPGEWRGFVARGVNRSPLGGI